MLVSTNGQERKPTPPSSQDSSFLSEVRKKIFYFDQQTTASEAFKKVLPTKCGGWRRGDLSDIRGLARKNLEQARARFDIAVGKAFNQNDAAGEKKTKFDLLVKCTEGYCVFHMMHDFLSDEQFVTDFCQTYLTNDPTAQQNFKTAVQTLLENFTQITTIRSQAQRYIGKEYELKQKLAQLKARQDSTAQTSIELEKIELEIAEIQDKYVEMCNLSTKTERTYNQCLNNMDFELKSILGLVKRIQNEKQTSSKKNLFEKKSEDFFNLIQNLSVDLKVDKDVLDFIFVKHAIANDVDFEAKIVGFICHILFDPKSCDNLVMSMGLTGQAFLACLSTRSYFFNQIHSRRLLPDSAFVFFKMLGLKKESLRFIQEKLIAETGSGNQVPAVKMSAYGTHLYQETQNMLRENESETTRDRINNISVSLFGHARQESGDKNGYANSLWEEISARWDKVSIYSYLKTNKILNTRKDIPKVARKHFLKSIKILEQRDKEEIFCAPGDKFKNRAIKLKLSTQLLINSFDKNNNQSLKNTASELKEKIEDIISMYSEKRVVDILELNSLEEEFLDLTTHYFQSLNSTKEDLSTENDSEKIDSLLTNTIMQIQISQFLRNYDLTINQMAKMAASLLDSKGIVRSIIDKTKSKITKTKELISQEVASLKENEDLKILRRACSDQQAVIALICCHKEFSVLESSSNSESEIQRQVLEIFSTKIASVFLSKSIAATEFVKLMNKNFIKMISHILFQKKYSEFSKLLKIKLILKDGGEQVFSFDELSSAYKKNEENLSSHTDLTSTKFLNELFGKMCRGEVKSFEVVLDEKEEHNVLLKKIEHAVSEMETVFVKNDALTDLSSILILNQKYSLLNVINEIIKQFGLSGTVANNLKQLAELMSDTHSLSESAEKKQRLADIEKQIKENRILTEILEKINELNATSKQFRFSDTDLIFHVEKGIAGRVFLEHRYTGSSSSVKKEDPKTEGGLFFRIFEFILEKILPGEMSPSVTLQLKDESSFRIKIDAIAQAFYRSLLDFSKFAQDHLTMFSEISEQISQISVACEGIESMLSSEKNPIESSVSLDSFSKKLQKMSRFSLQIEAIVSHVKSTKEKITAKLHLISDFVTRDSTLIEKKDTLDSMYCTEECATAFESAYFHSCQIESSEKLQPPESLISRFLCRTTFNPSNSVGGDTQIIPLHDAHPFRHILGDGFRSFLITFFKFRLGRHSEQDREGDFLNILDLWTKLSAILKAKPYVFEGYYFKGSGFADSIIQFFSKRVGESVLSDDVMANILNEIDDVKSFLLDGISKFNACDFSDINEASALRSLLYIKEEKFCKLEQKLSQLMKGKNLSSEQFEKLKLELEFIGSINKFNVEFFKTGHSFLKKVTSNLILENSFQLSTKETEYEEHLILVKKSLFDLRKQIVLIENRAAVQGGISILEQGNDLFIGNKQIDPGTVARLKSDFILYKNRWEKLVRLYFDLESDDIKKIILRKIQAESKSFQKIEIDLLVNQSFLSILNDSDAQIGPILFGELVLFRFLKEKNLLESFESIREFIHKKDAGLDSPDNFTTDELNELKSIATEFQDRLNIVAEKKQFKQVVKTTFTERMSGRFSEWFWSSDKVEKRQIQLNVKSSSALKISVKKLLEDMVKFAFEQTTSDFDSISEQVHQAERIAEDCGITMQSVCLFQKQISFINKVKTFKLEKLFSKNEFDELAQLQGKIELNMARHLNEQSDYSEFSEDLMAYNKLFVKVQKKCSQNNHFGNILFCQTTSKAGVSYFDFVPNIEDLLTKENSYIKEYLQNIFPYPAVLNNLFSQEGVRPIDVLISLGSQTVVLEYKKQESSDVLYALNRESERIFSDGEDAFSFRVNFEKQTAAPEEEGTFQLTQADGMPIPFGENPYEFTECCRLREEAQNIFQTEVLTLFFADKMLAQSQLKLPETKNSLELKKYLENYILYQDESKKSAVIFNFLTKKYYYVSNFSSQNSTKDEIVFGDLLLDKKYKTVSMAFLGLDGFQYIGIFNFENTASKTLRTLTLERLHNLCHKKYGLEKKAPNLFKKPLVFPPSIDCYRHLVRYVFDLQRVLGNISNLLSLPEDLLSFPDNLENNIVERLENSLGQLHKKDPFGFEFNIEMYHEIQDNLFQIFQNFEKQIKEWKSNENYTSFFYSFDKLDIFFKRNIFQLNHEGFIQLFCFRLADDQSKNSFTFQFSASTGKQKISLGRSASENATDLSAHYDPGTGKAIIFNFNTVEQKMKLKDSRRFPSLIEWCDQS